MGVRRDGSRYSRPASPHEHDWTEAVAVEKRWAAATGDECVHVVVEHVEEPAA